jgi:hypothetical protein
MIVALFTVELPSPSNLRGRSTGATVQPASLFERLSNPPQPFTERDRPVPLVGGRPATPIR